MASKDYFSEYEAPERFLYVYVQNIRNVTIALNVMGRTYADMLRTIIAADKVDGPYSPDEFVSQRDRPDTFHMVYREMSITHNVAIFDSFLNSMTRYVMFRMPDKVLGSTAVEVRQLIAKSSTQIIAEQLDKKAEALSRESFIARVRFLEKILEIDFAYEKAEISKVKEIVRIRNLITHDARSFHMVLNEDRSVDVGAIREVVDSDLDADIETLERLVPKLYKGCCTALLGRELNEGEVKILDLMSSGWESPAKGA